MLSIPGEKTICQKLCVTLTTHRVQLDLNRWRAKKFTTIMLEDLSSCDIESRSKPEWLAASLGSVAIGAVISLNAGNPIFVKSVAGIAALCFLAYILTRAKVMVLRSASEKIESAARGEKWQDLKQFVNQIETAKHERLMLLAQPKEPPKTTSV